MSLKKHDKDERTSEEPHSVHDSIIAKGQTRFISKKVSIQPSDNEHDPDPEPEPESIVDSTTNKPQEEVVKENKRTCTII